VVNKREEDWMFATACNRLAADIAFSVGHMCSTSCCCHTGTQVGEHSGPNLNSLTVGDTVAVSVSSDATLRLYVNDVDHGVVAHDVSLTRSHVVVDLYGKCDKLSVDNCSGLSASVVVPEYQEKAAKENGNCIACVSMLCVHCVSVTLPNVGQIW